MKLKNVLLTVGLALSIGGGVGAGLALQSAKTVVETKADSSSPLEVFYFDVSSYGVSDYDFYAYIWTQTYTDGNWVDSNQTVVKATQVSGMYSLFEVNNSSGANAVIACAVTKNASFTTSDWSNVKKQTWDKKPQWSNGIPTQNAEYGVNTLTIGDLADGKYDATWQTRDPSIVDGAYLKGTYHGTEDWANPATLSNDKVTESIVWNSSENKAHATLELYAGDTFKFCRYQNGVQIAMPTTFSIETTDSTYYPVGYSSNNVRVTNSGIYYITVGYGTDGNASNFWYYFDNSATVFANEFLNSMTCDSNGINEPSWNDGYNWSYFSTWYSNTLDSYAKDTFYSATINDGGSSIEKCVSRHNTIVTNHGYAAFVTNSSGTARSGVAAPITSSIFVGSDNSTLIIAVVSFATILATSGFFFLRRKKEQ